MLRFFWVMKEMEKLNKQALFAKSFYLLGDTLNYCYDCKYCRLNGEKCEEKHYHVLPSEINPYFKRLPIAVNLFYGDPLLQVDKTINLLRRLEKVRHEGPVIIITKGDFTKFPDLKFDLDLHVAFSCFGINSYLDGSTIERFLHNLENATKRKNKYKYSIEFRPIIYNVNDSKEVFDFVLDTAQRYNLPVGYSGLQGKKESVEIWKREKINLRAYPGYELGHKKIIAPKVVELFEKMAQAKGVPIFRKTSCLISYTHNLERDYNAHYYRPNEVGCFSCPMQERCFNYKNNLTLNPDLDDIIPFKYEVVEKQNHECILKKQGLCQFPTEDCTHIGGKIIQIPQAITTSDVRVIKWLTGYTVDANFWEDAHISQKWQKEAKLVRNKEYE